METQLTTELLGRLDELAQTLGTTTEYLWSVLIYQSFIAGLVGLIAAGVLLLIGIWPARVVFQGLFLSSIEDKEMACTFVIIGLLMVIAVLITDNIMGVIYPEGAALSELMKYFR